ncbi:MAG: 50S ribosomal protein L10 [Candidatus Thermoplasmatota archaeon]|nr:50S ribosomal protein L10 [Euryarchaeota archaeon]MBU4032393.1 50S ribosomal protein L10 [Candidatus Thermoplasmatota archaeon]MBU4071015.1 50S ribosomal protein L10 [Candidatus Thermoplasmatota archaeon]MBU4144818.1 50S ribosomal protein L10 [Candidatus Thermoplasmatota archaeon]MBU4591819.1 50S ribosomal protein L10 [Candidatus Thermoplasmatota archaeon]
MDREPANWKLEYLKDLKQVIQSSPVIAIVRVNGIPAPQFQSMRANLRGKVSFIVAKNNLIQLALKEMEGEKNGLSGLSQYIDGQCALVGSTDNPFKLNKIMEATMTASPAKGGEIAPDDIGVKAGETSFKPGPIVGELQQAGIPAAIESGKVVIKKDKQLVKAGEPIPLKVAQMLTKLEIFPLTVGMDLRGVYENGLVFKSDVLAIDEVKFMGDLLGAISGSFGVAIKIGYTTPMTIRPLITKGYSEAMAVALFAGIANKTTIDRLVGMANAKMMALATLVPDALDDELKATLAGAASAAAAAAPAAKADEKKEEPKEEPKVSEDDAAAGLGALFG